LPWLLPVESGATWNWRQRRRRNILVIIGHGVFKFFLLYNV
jgi:hypothetical protein